MTTHPPISPVQKDTITPHLPPDNQLKKDTIEYKRHHIAPYMQEAHKEEKRAFGEGNITRTEKYLTIVDKNKKEVPFILNPPQKHFIRNATRKNVILKARKMGFSSIMLACAVLRLIYGRNEKCVCMSFDQSAAQKQLERAKHFIRSWETAITKELIESGQLQQGKTFTLQQQMKYNNKNELSLQNTTPDGVTYTNTLRIGTAKSTSFGRGDDITFLHITEASFADDMEVLLAGVGEAVIDNSITVLETTANGFNSFKGFWDEVVLGERGYRPFFYDPTWEYSEEFVSEKRKGLGRLGVQEFPMSPEEAFLTSGDCYFDLLALRNYNDNAKDPITTQFTYL